MAEWVSHREDISLYPLQFLHHILGNTAYYHLITINFDFYSFFNKFSKEFLLNNRILSYTSKINNESISIIEDIDKLLNMTGDGAAYLIVAGENGIKVLVSIPSFSAHIVDIMEMEGASEGATPGFGFLIAIAAVVLYAAFIRKFQ